jgi:hypothetical protein
MVPVEESDKPVGSCPELTLQLTGDVPPEAARLALYPELTVPLGSELVLITRGAAAAVETAMLRAFVAFWTVLLESAACTVKLNVPDADGVPDIDPEELRLSPVGNCPALILHV